MLCSLSFSLIFFLLGHSMSEHGCNIRAYIGDGIMQKMTNAIDNYPFTPDVVLPEINLKERIEKHRDMIIREFSERMLYWVLPWFIIGLMVATHYEIWGFSGFLITVGVLLLSGFVLRLTRGNRHLLYFFESCPTFLSWHWHFLLPLLSREDETFCWRTFVGMKRLAKEPLPFPLT